MILKVKKWQANKTEAESWTEKGKATEVCQSVNQNWEHEADNFETTLKVFRSQAALPSTTEKFKFLNTVSQYSILMAQTNGFSLTNEEEHSTNVSKCHVTL